MDKKKISYIEFITMIKNMQFQGRREIWINEIRLFWDETKIYAYAPYETDREVEGCNLSFYSNGGIVAEIDNLDYHTDIFVLWENEVTGCGMMFEIKDTFVLGPERVDS